ncbi:MAG: protease modulator HflC [Betaproteobacteria bacterium]|nr:protease modulator HflC [Betaproteobacteria bacterium]
MEGIEGTAGDHNRRHLRRASVWIAFAVLAALAVRACLFVVDSAQYAVVTAFGKPVQVVKHPGLGFKLPYESVRFFDNRLDAFTPASSEFLTIEKTAVVAAGTITWRIAEPQKFFETVFDLAGAQSRLADILFAELGAAIGRNALASFVSADSGVYRAEAILSEVTDKCRTAALRDYGIEIAGVQLQSFDFPKQNRARVYARMASERGRLSMRYRSEGEEEGSKVRAAADREKTRILSESLKLAQQHRGEGEAQAARIYAQTLAQSPEFYRFMRTMEASRTLLPKSTTLVLPLDSELFGLLTQSGYFGGGARRQARAKEGAMR